MNTNDILKVDFPNINFPKTGATAYLTIPKEHATDDIYNIGRKYEEDLLIILQQPQYIFKDTPRWSKIDFICETNKTNIFIELKTRNFKITDFNTTIITESKIRYYQSLNKVNENKQNRLILIFAFIPSDNNKNIRDYYYIKYEPQLFKRLERKIIFNKTNIEIPTEYLKPIADFAEYIKKY
jgi:Holliday junction resolvase-like predicted endonuclease